MSEELNKQVGTEGAESPGDVQTEAAPGEATSSLSIEEQINAAVKAAVAEYEGTGGHLSRLKSKKDKEIAALKRQLAQQTSSRLEEAQQLIDSDPARAASLLVGIVEAQAQETRQQNASSELIDWQRRILTDLGANPDEDDETAIMAAEWANKILEDPDLAWDFPVEAAKRRLSAKEQELKEATKELAALKEGLPALIEAQVTKALVTAGITPEPTGDGEPAPREEDWRSLSPSALIKMGMRERAKKPIQR